MYRSDWIQIDSMRGSIAYPCSRAQAPASCSARPLTPLRRSVCSAISAFLTDFLHEQKGMSVEAATSLVFVFGMGCFLGNMAGGCVTSPHCYRARNIHYR